MNDDLFWLEDVSLCSGDCIRLDHFSLHIPFNEITGIVGPSNSGKTSLCNLLTGKEHYNSGLIYHQGTLLAGHFVPTGVARRIVLIPGTSRLPPQFTVAEMLALFAHFRRKRIFLKKKTIRARAHAILELLHIPLQPDTKILKLTLAQQHLLLLAGAYLEQAELVILNNNISYYTDQEWAITKTTLELLKAKGIAVLLTASRESRLTEICSSITVLRGRTNLKTFLPTEYTALRLGLHYRQESHSFIQVEGTKSSSNPPLFSASHLSTSTLREGGFDLYPGEIVGFFDASNTAGQELYSALTGMDPTCGEYKMHGVPLPAMGYSGCIRHGIGFMSDDPTNRNCFPCLSALDNILCISRNKLGCLFFFHGRLKRHLAAHYAKQLGFTPTQLNVALERFNTLDRLRITLCRWDLVDLNVLFCSRLFESADAEAKMVIKKALRAVASKGAAVGIFGYDWSNMLEICDYIYIIDDGHIRKRLSKDEASFLFHRATYN